MLDQLVRNVHSLYLCFRSIPGAFLDKERNAEYHLKYVCPLCPEIRRKTRDVESEGLCWWESNWKNCKYNIPRTFGVINYLRASFNQPTKLDKFKELN